jgi:hypothetical protein
MHHADQAAARGKAAGVDVVVFRQLVGLAVSRRRVGVQMNLTVGVAVNVEVNPLADDPPEDACAQQDQHDADGVFQPRGQMWAHRALRDEHRAGEHGERQYVPEPPDRPLANDVPLRAAVGRQAGHGGQMVGFQGMLHAQQQTQKEHPRHAVVAPPCVSART